MRPLSGDRFDMLVNVKSFVASGFAFFFEHAERSLVATLANSAQGVSSKAGRQPNVTLAAKGSTMFDVCLSGTLWSASYAREMLGFPIACEVVNLSDLRKCVGRI